MREYREIRLDPRNPLVWEPGVSAAVEALEEGGILVHPTSTVYGIGAAATRELNAEINRLKGRPPNRSLIRLAGSVEVLRRELPGAAWDDRADKLATEFWPGPLTLILDDGSDEGLAVRVDGHPILLVVLGRWRSLMTSTSLNLEGEPPATRRRPVREVLEAMPEPAGPTIFLGAGSLPASTSSTVVSRKWKMLAARAASALPAVSASHMCSALPAPPEAITGISRASETARVRGMSKPSFVPSQSMLVRRISPAPKDSILRTHSRVSIPVGFRPPWV